MTPVKIRNFYFQRFIEKLKKIKFIISKIFYNSPIYGKLNFDELTNYTEITMPNLWEGDIEKIKNFLKNKIPNNKKNKDPFFFYFHSFDFLNDLQQISKENLRIHGRELTSHWIKKNNSWKSKTWDDFILATRICNWFKNFNFFFSTADEEFKKKIKALIYVSISIPNKKYYYQIAIFNLKSELGSQILKDGCHFQRNPKIHVQVLMDLLDIRSILNSTKKNVFFDLQSAIKNMSVVYHFFLHKDNSLANFNGTNNVNEKETKNIISEIPKLLKKPRELSDSGFQRVDKKDTI